MKYTNAEKLRYFQKYENNSSPDRQNDRQSAISRVWRTFGVLRFDDDKICDNEHWGSLLDVIVRIRPLNSGYWSK